MSVLESYSILFFLIFFINVIPAFMPPSWIILSFLYIQFHLLLLPTVFLGVVAATLGRIVLAIFARTWFVHIFPEKYLVNYLALGKFLEKNQKMTIPIIFGYAFSPISSNTLFIVAGLANINLKIIALSFFIGRAISYSFWITTSHQIEKRLDVIFTRGSTSTDALIGAFISILLVVLIGKINWEKLLHRHK